MCWYIGIQHAKQLIGMGTTYTANIVGTPELKLKICIEEDNMKQPSLLDNLEDNMKQPSLLDNLSAN